MLSQERERVAVIGAGLMGHGIAQEFACAGYAVRLRDLTDTGLAQARQQIRENLTRLAGLGLLDEDRIETAMARIQTTTELAEAVGEADYVVEAVTEDLMLKQRLFRELDALCPPRAILASNTSTFLPSRLAAVTNRPDRVLVAHYFNPPYLLPLVEVVPGAQTSQETVNTVLELLRGMGKRPVLVRKEVPGFIGNRLQAALLREACALVEQGIATPEDVDAVVQGSFGRRLSAAGVFTVSETAGWDLWVVIAGQLFPELESSREVPRLLREKVARGELGLKSGKGFYAWDVEAGQAIREKIRRALIEIARREQ